MGFKPKPKASQAFFKRPKARPKSLEKKIHRRPQPADRIAHRATRAAPRSKGLSAAQESKTAVSNSKQLIADLSSGCFSGVPEGKNPTHSTKQ
jgi:hypothetical protein